MTTVANVTYATLDWAKFEEVQKRRASGLKKSLDRAKRNLDQAEFCLHILKGFRDTFKLDYGSWHYGYYVCLDNEGKYFSPLELVDNSLEPKMWKPKRIGELQTATCPKCEEDHLLVVEDVQTQHDNDYHNSEWTLRHMVICPIQGEVFEIKEVKSGYRTVNWR